jgi:hypothetical protein
LSTSGVKQLQFHGELKISGYHNQIQRKCFAKKKQRKCKPREGESQSHPDSSRVEKGEVDLEGDPAGGEAAGEEHGRPQLVGEHRRDTAAEVPRGAL